MDSTKDCPKGGAFRSNVLPFFNHLGELELEARHLKALKATQFYAFVDAVIQLKKSCKKNKKEKMDTTEFNKSPKTLAGIIKCFEYPNTFKFGSQILELDANAIAVEFCMKRKKMRPEESMNYWPKIDRALMNCHLYTEYLKQQDEPKITEQIQLTTIVKGIKKAFGEEGKEKEFVQLLVLFLLCTIFTPINNTSYIHCKYLSSVQSIEAIQSISWPDLIYENLTACLKEQWPNPYSLNGCGLFLLCWVFEHITDLERKENSEQLPRFARWNLAEVSKMLNAKFSDPSKIELQVDVFSASLTDSERQLCLEDTLHELKRQNQNKDKRISYLESEAAKNNQTIADLRNQLMAGEKHIPHVGVNEIAQQMEERLSVQQQEDGCVQQQKQVRRSNRLKPANS